MRQRSLRDRPHLGTGAMLLRRTQMRLAIFALATAGNGLACRANDDAFYAAAFACSTASGTDQCGTTKSGKTMTCYAGSQLGGGSDFCTEACDPNAGGVDSGHVCLSSGALLVKCVPNPDAGTPNGCPAGLNCYRTDLAANEGVCLMMEVCTTDSECTDSRRPKCGATILHELKSAITTDHLMCVQPTCATSGSSCDVGESCSANYYNTGTTNLPDICIPNCLHDQDCPPDFACAQNAGAAGAPSVCVPGVPGQRCNHQEDCLWGDCLDTGAGFSECVVAWNCTTDANCDIFDAPGDSFACANGKCVALAPFQGASCVSDSNCTNGQQCFRYSPFGLTDPRGECRPPCGADLSCPSRGGVLQVCLDGGAGGCYPIEFGLPCTASSQCPSAFTCTAVSPDPRTVIDSPTICTISCATDGDCQSQPLIGKNGGFCDSGVCRMTGQPGVTCERDTECNSGVCAGGRCS